MGRRGVPTVAGVFPEDGVALVVGASGGIGEALLAGLREDGGFGDVVGWSRAGLPPVDITVETSIAAAVAALAGQRRALRLVLDATGILHDDACQPERSLRQLEADHMARSFAVNAIGPALLMKHLLPLAPRDGRFVFATLSARVGSIADNHLGGWYSYRASKAALNQVVRTAAVELRRRRPEAVCVAVHPGTVDTGLSGPFAKTGLDVQTPAQAAGRLLAVLAGLKATDSGGFFDQHGQTVPW